jgi:hypothetical protein
VLEWVGGLMNICRVVGDDNNTLFWWDPWINGVVLKNTFSRLFYLSINKMTTVAGMYALGWGEEGNAWRWRHRLLAWEEEQACECIDLLTNIILQSSIPERWL